jgi:lysophospholipase L1-like esterase
MRDPPVSVVLDGDVDHQAGIDDTIAYGTPPGSPFQDCGNGADGFKVYCRSCFERKTLPVKPSENFVCFYCKKLSAMEHTINLLQVSINKKQQVCDASCQTTTPTPLCLIEREGAVGKPSNDKTETKNFVFVVGQEDGFLVADKKPSPSPPTPSLTQTPEALQLSDETDRLIAEVANLIEESDSDRSVVEGRKWCQVGKTKAQSRAKTAKPKPFVAHLGRPKLTKTSWNSEVTRAERVEHKLMVIHPACETICIGDSHSKCLSSKDLSPHTAVVSGGGLCVVSLWLALQRVGAQLQARHARGSVKKIVLLLGCNDIIHHDPAEFKLFLPLLVSDLTVIFPGVEVIFTPPFSSPDKIDPEAAKCLARASQTIADAHNQPDQFRVAKAADMPQARENFMPDGLHARYHISRPILVETILSALCGNKEKKPQTLAASTRPAPRAPWAKVVVGSPSKTPASPTVLAVQAPTKDDGLHSSLEALMERAGGKNQKDIPRLDNIHFLQHIMKPEVAEALSPFLPQAPKVDTTGGKGPSTSTAVPPAKWDVLVLEAAIDVLLQKMSSRSGA